MIRLQKSVAWLCIGLVVFVAVTSTAAGEILTPPFTDAQVAAMGLPLSAAPRRPAPPPGRLCGRSPASPEQRWVASLVVVPAGAPVSGARL